MNAPETLRKIAQEILRQADELELAMQPAPAKDVQLDLFSQMGLTAEGETIAAVEGLTPPRNTEPLREEQNPAPEVKRRTITRVGLKMADPSMVNVSTALSAKNGYYQRGNVEMKIAKMTGKTRKEVREAVNSIIEERQIPCFFYNTQRYYRKIDRATIIGAAVAKLSA